MTTVEDIELYQQIELVNAATKYGAPKDVAIMAAEFVNVQIKYAIVQYMNRCKNQDVQDKLLSILMPACECVAITTATAIAAAVGGCNLDELSLELQGMASKQCKENERRIVDQRKG